MAFALAYLNELLFNYTPHRLLRSSSSNLLCINPKTKTVTYGNRSFSVIALKLWNDLPIIIKQCFIIIIIINYYYYYKTQDPDSRGKHFPWFQILQANVSRIPEFGFPCMGR